MQMHNECKDWRRWWMCVIRHINRWHFQRWECLSISFSSIRAQIDWRCCIVFLCELLYIGIEYPWRCRWLLLSVRLFPHCESVPYCVCDWVRFSIDGGAQRLRHVPLPVSKPSDAKNLFESPKCLWNVCVCLQNVCRHPQNMSAKVWTFMKTFADICRHL